MVRGEKRPSRKIEQSYEIEAPVEAVWKALTDAEELTNWFPLEARVEPGQGGSIWMSWQDGEYANEGEIEDWRPNERLCIVHRLPDAKTGETVTVAQEFRIESRGGTTTLRLVHSGFGEDESWDDLYDATVRGWSFELRGLKHYLERHRGTRRVVAHARRHVSCALEEAWRKLTSRDGLAAEGRLAGLGAGDRMELCTANGLALNGPVWIHAPPRDLAAIIENLKDSYLRLRCDTFCGEPGKKGVDLWLSTYGLPRAEVESLTRSFDELLGSLFDEAE